MKLKEIVKICYGKNQKQVEVEYSDFPILGTGGVIGYSSIPLYDKESVLIGRKGTIDKPLYINKPFWTIDTLFYTKINTELVIPKFLYYLLFTIGLDRYSEGAAVPSLTTKTLYELDLNIPSKNIQQHIVDTIGSIDDLIENYQQQMLKLIKIGKLKVDRFNGERRRKKILSISSFEKGIEIGSSNYIENCDHELLIPYLRVGDLISRSHIFIEKRLSRNLAKETDILIAFDGAPGRNSIGLYGSYSSGIYKVISDDLYKGLIYFELNSDLNQKIIADYTQGTTILHASKAIPFIEICEIISNEMQELNTLFFRLVLLKKKIFILHEQKQLLLKRYFTNQ